MALDPQFQAELERRGPANVRALLDGLGGGVGRNTLVPLQLAAGVSDPPRGEVEDWWREKELEKEREAERVASDTLKWAKVGGKWSRIGGLAAVAAALAGIATIGVTLYIARQDNAPKLALAGPRIDLRAEPKTVWLDFANTGRNPARQGKAILFEVGKDKDWAHKRQVGEADIIGAGTSVMPGYNGRAEIRFSGQLPGFLLACVSYHDEDNRLYQQMIFCEQEQ